MMKVKKFKKGEILFAEEETMVILDGLVFMKSHVDNVIPPMMLAKYT